ISAGCAGFPLEADCAQDLLVVADRRLYADKRARKAALDSGRFAPPSLPLATRGDGAQGAGGAAGAAAAIDEDPPSRSIAAPQARAVAQAAMIEPPVGEAVVIDVDATDTGSITVDGGGGVDPYVADEVDPETARIVGAARAA